jgi:hypothetical protein
VSWRTSLTGAVAGGLAAAVWAIQQPFDKRLFGTEYDDVELLGKSVTRGAAWPVAGFAIHVANGAIFGALYAQAKLHMPGPAPLRGFTAAMVENFGLWSLGRLSDRWHPARNELEGLGGNRRALAAATWRHALFGIVLGSVEERLSAATIGRPGPSPAYPRP